MNLQERLCHYTLLVLAITLITTFLIQVEFNEIKYLYHEYTQMVNDFDYEGAEGPIGVGYNNSHLIVEAIAKLYISTHYIESSAKMNINELYSAYVNPHSEPDTDEEESPANSTITSMYEAYLNISDEVPIKKHIFGDLDHIYTNNTAEVDAIFQNISRGWGCLRNNSQGIIHVELGGTALGIPFMAKLKSYLLNTTDSIGVNIDQLLALNMALNSTYQNIIPPTEIEKVALNYSIKELERLVYYIQDNHLSISRIHLHARHEQFICYKSNLWTEANIPLMKSVLAILSAGKDDQYIYDPKNIFIQLPVEYKIKQEKAEEKIQFSIYDIQTCWDLEDNWRCCFALNLLYKKANERGQRRRKQEEEIVSSIAFAAHQRVDIP